MSFSIFKRRGTVRVEKTEALVVSVPDIKDCLVKEYERTRSLESEIEALRRRIEDLQEVETKYAAAMVTLEEYSDRLSYADNRISEERRKTEAERERYRNARDEANNIKILLSKSQGAKKELVTEIVGEVKRGITADFKRHKGNLSKATACEIVAAFSLGGDEMS